MKILKFILGLIAGLSGVVALFAGGKKKQKIKEIKQDIKQSERKVDNLKEKNKEIEKTQKNYIEAVEQLKKSKINYKKKNVSVKKANNFLKSFAKDNKSE